MNRLCLGTFLTAIKRCAVKKGFVQRAVFQDMFVMMDHSYEPDESLIGHIVRGAKNPPRTFLDKINDMDSSEYPDFVTCMDGVASRIDPNKEELLGMLIKTIVDDDETIVEDTIVDLVNGTSKKDLPGNYKSLPSFLAGLFIYVVKCTDNRKMEGFVKTIDERYIADILTQLPEYNSNDNNSLRVTGEALTEVEIIKAKKFLIDHECEKELIPLCAIANLYSPEHKHIRSMYTEFGLLPKKIQRHILKSCDAEEMIKTDALHFAEALDFFCEDLRKHELSSEQYLYLFGQYTCRAFSYYSECSIDFYDKYSFARLCKSSILFPYKDSRYSLDAYIEDYLWMKRKETSVDVLPPMDYLWIEKNLETCSEEELTFWICRFIIDACNSLFYIYKKSDTKYTIIDDQYAETQEDMFYCALNALNNHYLCRIDKSEDNLIDLGEA